MARIKTIEYFRVKPRWLFVKVTDVEGYYGWGESTLEGHTEAVEGALTELSERFKGYEANNIEHIWQSAWRHGFYRGGPVLTSAISGVDIALWDLKGRRLGIPVHQLLGGRVRDKISVYAWIGGDRPSDVESAGKTRLVQGFRTVKMNATEDLNWLDSPSLLESSVERLEKIKEIGLDVALDFHGRLHKPMAKQLAKAVEPYHPLFIEEPLLPENPEGIRQLSGLVACPIALGERLFSRWDTKRFLREVSVDILQPDVSHCGGISELRRIAAMAETFDVTVAPHCPIGPIALAACMQVDLMAPNFSIQEMGLGIHYNVQSGEYDITSYLKNPGVFDVKDGYVDALTGPGLGIEIDEEMVRQVAKVTEPWRSGAFYGPDSAIREW